MTGSDSAGPQQETVLKKYGKYNILRPIKVLEWEYLCFQLFPLC